MNYDIQFVPCYNCGHNGHKVSVSLPPDTHPRYQKFICSNTNCNRKQITVRDTLNRLFVKAFSRQRNMRNSVVEDPRRAVPQIAYGALGMTGTFVMGRQHPENKTANLNFDREVAKIQYCRQPMKRHRLGDLAVTVLSWCRYERLQCDYVARLILRKCYSKILQCYDFQILRYSKALAVANVGLSLFILCEVHFATRVSIRVWHPYVSLEKNNLPSKRMLRICVFVSTSQLFKYTCMCIHVHKLSAFILKFLLERFEKFP